MLSESQILSTLDNSNKTSDYSHFIALGQPYSYLIDCRLNIFVGDNKRWAIVSKRLGYNPRGGAIELEISYFGNCLSNLENYNGQLSNYYYVYPLNQDVFDETIEISYLKPDSKYWLIRGIKVALSNYKQDYIDNKIQLKDYKPGQVGIEESARLLIIKHSDLFRANEKELYKSIPHNLKKLLVLNEWYHKDFTEIETSLIPDEHLKYIYDFNKELTSLERVDFKTFHDIIRKQESSNKEINQSQWTNNRPSSYETWQQLAKVIATGDVSFYRPTLPANTHWIHWPESGSL